MKKIKNIFKKTIKILVFILKYFVIGISKLIFPLFVLLLFIGFSWWSSQTPSLYRDWVETESVLSEIAFSGSEVGIKNIRNFSHISQDTWKSDYYDVSFDVDEIESLYYIIEPFSNYDGPAHTMLSFGFSDGRYVTVSAELRKEKGEGFDPFLGIMNQFEIVYILGSENDLIKLRANIRKDTVRLYPMKVSKKEIKELFLSVLHRADKLSKEPEFYNTLWNTCTTSILKHVNSFKKDKITSFDMRILLPSNSDEIAYNLGLIDTTLSLEEARKYYKINDLSVQNIDPQSYSKEIRKEIK